ncbi:membrane protein [Advenella faeciporci]|uniref:Membrane protein n=1 Tax=Advenella faeciporci TaxID=797535 RepID=A0A918JFF0_9BURK|nr:OmpA family protein [Advenella faeciporci]GGW76136.1 membrane protein [Advenella faeciporci]
MNKPSKFALAFAVVAAATSGVASAQTVDNWVNPYGLVWMNGTNEHCWRDNFWTPATAAQGCGAPQSPDIVAQKVTFNADTFFDFDKSTLKPEGRNILDQVAQQTTQLNLESVIAVGHTDSIGTVQYNQGLSERRAAAVKNYLISKGVPADQIIASGKGESDPIASNATREGRAKNRRVEIEIVGSRK